MKSTGSWYLVRKEDGGQVECRMRGKLRTEGIRTTNPVAVGDVVDMEAGSDGYIISKIHTRRNYIIRKSTNLSKEAHIIASNVDLAMLVVTVNHPVTPTVFIDRFLVAAEAYNIPAVVVFNKTDIYSEDDGLLLGALTDIYRKAGYPCLAISVTTGEHIGEVRELLKDKITVLSGMSGVGKSSLINSLEPELSLKTATISNAHDSGKHTTTFAEMFALSEGGFIVDTPGLRSFGMIDMKKEELSHYFPEIFSRAGECRFYNCMHVHEPGCAVLAALDTGEVSESRYVSYLSMMEEEKDNKYR